ncbi:ATP-binding cassette domain-containing protein [Streptomyces violaceusniger]|uniref:ATP-binding cassette domain-containing protein n=1 Tax=Streptomyces violaceusniger TaxID=68280 RepID=UPI003438B54F
MTARDAAAHRPLVEVDSLSVAFRGRAGTVRAVEDVSFAVHPGECVAIVGESGSGKSVTARSLVGLNGREAIPAATALRVGGRDALGFSQRDWRAVRGRFAGLVLQDALVSLDPLRTVGQEAGEAIRHHRLEPRGRVRDRVLDTLRAVGMPDPERRIDAYPHELSGGLRQRTLIASAIAAEPRLIIADEPTTALDVTVQRQVVQVLADRVTDGTGLLLISHDLAVIVLALTRPDSGEVRLHGRPWSALTERERRASRRLVQYVPQDPLSSFDPRWTVGQVLAENIHRENSRARRRDLAVAALERVGLSAGHLTRRPRSLSGGQRQRVAIARALMGEPEIIVCDEPVSALDVLIQAQVLDLIADLRAELGTSLLFISHDLGVVHHLTDRVLVFKDGQVVERGDVDEVFTAPSHPYTRELLSSLPGRELRAS